MSDRGADDLAVIRAVLLVNDGKRADAITQLDGRHPDPPLDLAAWLLLAGLLEHDNVEKSRALYSRALQHYAQHPVANLRAGVFTYGRGDAELARILLERSWAAGPSAEAGVYLARLYAARGESLRAATFLAQAASFEPYGGPWRAEAIREILDLWPSLEKKAPGGR
ncbi:MAG TPA: hypothetical protein VMI93_12180 [Candidatus Solibacter sp.]|nr:hypothetical protein [Candidatus Solibacter sp.]